MSVMLRILIQLCEKSQPRDGRKKYSTLFLIKYKNTVTYVIYVTANKNTIISFDFEL